MKKILLAILIIVCPSVCKAQMLSVGTDVMLDALQTPNIGFDMVVGERATLGLSVFGNSKPWGKDIRIVGVQPEWRYYFSGRPMHHHFVGIGAIGASYDIHWKDKVYDGSAYGAGVTFGYVLNITKRLNVDFHAGLGIVAYSHKEYYETDNYDEFSVNGVVKNNADGYYMIPTRIGVSLTYILK